MISGEQLLFVSQTLAQEPFCIKQLRVVDLVEQTSKQRLQLLKEVCCSIDPSLKDTLNAEKQELVSPLLKFLTVLKYSGIAGKHSNRPTSALSTVSSQPLVEDKDDFENHDAEENIVDASLSRQEWAMQLLDGQKNVVLPLIHWLLTNREDLVERAYLSKYLMPLKVPLNISMGGEIGSGVSTVFTKRMSIAGSLAPSRISGEVSSRSGTSARGGTSVFGGVSSRAGSRAGSQRSKNSRSDPGFDLMELVSKYAQMQEDFAEIHKEYKAKILCNQDVTVKSPKETIANLEGRKSQLMDRLRQVHRNYKNDASRSQNIEPFDVLLEACRRSREASLEEAKLTQQLIDQRFLFKNTQIKVEEMEKRADALNAIQRISAENPNVSFVVESLLEYLKSEIEKKKHILQGDMAEALMNKTEELEMLTKDLNEPLPTGEDLDRLSQEVEYREEGNAKQKQVVIGLERQKKGQILEMFRQQSNLVLSKISNKRSDIAEKEKQLKHIKKEVLYKKMELHKLAKRNMRIENITEQDIEEFLMHRRQQIELHGSLQAKLEIKNNHLKKILSQELVLQAKVKDHEENLSDKERKAGVPGASKVKIELKALSEKIATLDEEKNKYLWKMVPLVDNIIGHMKLHKLTIDPLLQELRTLKKEEASLQEIHDHKKPKYASVERGYLSDIKDLETQCDYHRDGLIELERRFHITHAKLELVRADMKRVEKEERCGSGRDRFSPEFATAFECYNAHLQEQVEEIKRLRAEHRELSRNSLENVKQKESFSKLRKLLDFKLNLSSEDEIPTQNVIEFGAIQK